MTVNIPRKTGKLYGGYRRTILNLPKGTVGVIPKNSIFRGGFYKVLYEYEDPDFGNQIAFIGSIGIYLNLKNSYKTVNISDFCTTLSEIGISHGYNSFQGETMVEYIDFLKGIADLHEKNNGVTKDDIYRPFSTLEALNILTTSDSMLELHCEYKKTNNSNYSDYGFPDNGVYYEIFENTFDIYYVE